LQYFIGLMSGTSLDGVDGVVVQISSPSLLSNTRQLKVLQHVFQPFDAEFRAELLSLNTPGNNELHRAALAGNRLARSYSQVVHALLKASGMQANDIQAVGAHGQTVRHRPLEFDANPATGQAAVGYTLQLNNPALWWPNLERAIWRQADKAHPWCQPFMQKFLATLLTLWPWSTLAAFPTSVFCEMLQCTTQKSLASIAAQAMHSWTTGFICIKAKTTMPTANGLREVKSLMRFCKAC
jgi:hypothetical protein